MIVLLKHDLSISATGEYFEVDPRGTEIPDVYRSILPREPGEAVILEARKPAPEEPSPGEGFSNAELLAQRGKMLAALGKAEPTLG